MKDILKMIRLDLITVEKITPVYVLGFVLLSVIFAIFGIPLGALCPAAVFCLIAPLSMASDDENKLLHGMLPVSYSSIIRAGFIEIAGCLFAGQLLGIVCMMITAVTPFHKLLPDKMSELVSHFYDPNFNGLGLDFGEIMTILGVMFFYLFMLSVFLKMVAEVKGQGAAIRDLLIIGSVTVVLISLSTGLSYNEKLPILKTFIPDTAVGQILFIAALDLIAALFAVIFCELTIRFAHTKGN